ncbi:MAG TPA: amino acid ABC transporter permease [Rhodopila sp.]|uniref:amino acid ABC transporter permease n=1 Tax=Rhodopila sp. TaxID=2480087 RepID=UPI002B80EB27|nr:amino acid ABC transporter permease [Rhodopila sp.]HVY13896.1 amino acid ABC transporter permease [Rhodopila sp.]
MDLDFSPVIDSWRFLLGGLGYTVALAILTVLCSLVVGGAVGLARSFGPAWLRVPLVFYIDSMRAVPVLVVLVWCYFALPLLTGVTLPPFWAALVALTAQVAAFVAEIVRAGVGSVRPGQTRAALALGMSGAQAIREIVLPQAVVRMLPAFGSIISIAIKDTAIASVIAVPEYMNRSQTVAGQSFRPVEVFMVTMAVYFIILFPTTRIVDIAYARLAHLGRS